ncbi:MAG: ribulose-phosphate 3-epimerase [Muribaculaceae bacterium]|nr:ribulose-phosphate 3-epimerase [Muribaculaceae bacterium]
MLVSPSLLSADFGHLAQDLDMINRSEAHYLHLDVMDGVFVPNISFGFPVMKHVHDLCNKPLDVHLMIVEPQKFVTQVRDCGASIMTVHQEACTHLNRVVQQIKDAGMQAGVALNPATPVAMLRDIIADVDLVLLMSVNPGFGGQRFIPGTLRKVCELRQLISEQGSQAVIEVDGGVNAETGAQLAKAGCEVAVAGNYVFKSPDPHEAIHSLAAL